MPSSPAAPLRLSLPAWWLLDVDAIGASLTRTVVDAFVEMMLGPP